jgi:formylglycine-generating enzyme required for sulfatase activity
MKKYKKFTFHSFLPVVICIILATACNKNDKDYDINNPPIPLLNTKQINNISDTSATVSGHISSEGGSAVSARGVCWSMWHIPTIDDSLTIDGKGAGSFNSTITGLTSNTTYFVRAYATNNYGTGYDTVSMLTTRKVHIDISTVQIPAGTFTMGSPVTEKNRGSNEIQHQVTLSAFQMSKYEITNAQYAAFLNGRNIGVNGLNIPGGNPTQRLIHEGSHRDNYWDLFYAGSKWMGAPGYENYPVSSVTWYGATEFATYVDGRLPTEAEWEYACRATTTTPFNTGECLTDVQASYNWYSPYSNCTNTNPNSFGLKEVGTYPANAFGLHDMHGNVLEWCSDIKGYDKDKREIRGGNWSSPAEYCRYACKSSGTPDFYSGGTGFRIVFVP